MGIAFQPGRLAEQALGKYLFDSRFTLGEGENARGISDAIDFYLDGIRVIINPEHPEREWNVQCDATPFEKLQAAFDSVRGEKTQNVTASQRGDLVAYYRMLRNEQLKESRLFLWEYLAGYEPEGCAPYVGRAFIEENKLSECTGNEVAEKFQAWLEEHPEILRADRILLMKSSTGFQMTHLPPEIGLLTELSALTIRCTHLEEVPREIGNLSKLRKLNLSENCLKRLPVEIGELTALKFLKLDGNPLQELPPMSRLNLEIFSLPQHFVAEVKEDDQMALVTLNDDVKGKESAG